MRSCRIYVVIAKADTVAAALWGFNVRAPRVVPCGQPPGPKFMALQTKRRI